MTTDAQEPQALSDGEADEEQAAAIEPLVGWRAVVTPNRTLIAFGVLMLLALIPFGTGDWTGVHVTTVHAVCSVAVLAVAALQRRYGLGAFALFILILSLLWRFEWGLSDRIHGAPHRRRQRLLHPRVLAEHVGRLHRADEPLARRIHGRGRVCLRGADNGDAQSSAGGRDVQSPLLAFHRRRRPRHLGCGVHRLPHPSPARALLRAGDRHGDAEPLAGGARMAVDDERLACHPGGAASGDLRLRIRHRREVPAVQHPRRHHLHHHPLAVGGVPLRACADHDPREPGGRGEHRQERRLRAAARLRHHRVLRGRRRRSVRLVRHGRGSLAVPRRIQHVPAHHGRAGRIGAVARRSAGRARLRDRFGSGALRAGHHRVVPLLHLVLPGHTRARRRAASPP